MYLILEIQWKNMIGEIILENLIGQFVRLLSLQIARLLTERG